MRLGSRKLNIAGLVMIIGTLAMLLSACGTSSTKSDVAPKDKQIFKPQEIGPNAGDLATMDPALTNFGVDYDHQGQVFPGLIMLDNDLKTVDWAAQSHEVSSDGLTWTFHLRSGMKWSDGAPIDASVFAYSINRSLDPCTGSDVASYLYNIKGAADFNGGTCPEGAKVSTDTLVGKSVVVADPLTLKLTLDAPAAYFLGTFSYPTSWAQPKQLITQFGDKWTDHLGDGSGFGGNLFKVTKWDHAGHLELTVNDNFWGQKPTVQKVQYTLYKDTGTAWSAFKAGEGDVGFPLSQEIDIAKNLKGSTLHQIPQLAVSYLQPNWNIAPMDDARVRNAFSLAIDRKAIAHNVLKDTVQPSIHMVIQGLPGYNPNLKDSAGATGDAALVANTTKAKELMTSYAAEKCSGDLSKCTPVIFTITANRPTTALIAQAMLQEWQTAFPGLQITIATIDRALQIKSKTLMLTNSGWGADYPDPQDFLSLLWTKDASYNRSFVNVPEADAITAKADVSNDATGRLAQYQQAEQLWTDKGSWMTYAQPLQTYTVRNTIANFAYSSSLQTTPAQWQKVYVKA
jgi:peptide/nickel transport system substrate-binding protein/oligopeptide transport system substrate-binding protein